MAEMKKGTGVAGRSRGEIAQAWDALWSGNEAELGKLLGVLPSDLKNWRTLVDEAARHLRVAMGDKHQVAIVGPANSGKSTLYNTLIRSGKDRAEVSALPGTTRRAQEADAGLFTIVDTPGADAAGPGGHEDRERALAAAGAADLLIVLLDAEHGVRAPEQTLYNELSAMGKPMVVAMNKMDLVGKERGAVLGRAASVLGIEAAQLIPVSAKKGEGMDRLLVAVAQSEPAIVAALGAALPAYRGRLAESVITRAASTSAAVALTPLPFADFLPLIVVQSAMVMSIARIYAYRITLARARELVVTFGVGLLARSLFYELTKFGGPPGWLVGAAVAGGTTVAMGRAASVWFERGERLSGETLRRLSRSTSEALIGRLGRKGRRRSPGRGAVQSEVEQALADIAPGVDSESPIGDAQGTVQGR